MLNSFKTYRLVKTEDLNHHGTLFAGIGSQWLIESGLIACSEYIPSENIVCVKVHGMHFRRPVKLGEVICFESKVVDTGRTSLTAFINVTSKDNEKIVDGFVSYVNVDKNNVPFNHNAKLSIETEEEKELNRIAKELKKH